MTDRGRGSARGRRTRCAAARQARDSGRDCSAGAALLGPIAPPAPCSSSTTGSMSPWPPAQTACTSGRTTCPSPPPAAYRTTPLPHRLFHGRPGAARQAEMDGASYIGCGAVFGTTTKLDTAGERIGIAPPGRSGRGSDVPVVGIGGITTGTSAMSRRWCRRWAPSAPHRAAGCWSLQSRRRHGRPADQTRDAPILRDAASAPSPHLLAMELAASSTVESSVPAAWMLRRGRLLV
jgi:hypothetical protein